MAYTPYQWADSKAGGTPITAARLNAIEQGLDVAADVADAATISAAAAGANADSARGIASAASDSAAASKAVLDGLKPTLDKFTNQQYYNRLNVCDYGAKGDGKTDDRAAIQAALDAASYLYQQTGAVQEVYIPGRTFMLGVTAFYNASGSQYGICSLQLHSGTNIVGSGTLKLMAGTRGPGALFKLIASDATGISNSGIYGITIDGNKANNTSTDQSSNIVLYVQQNVIIQDISSIQADGEGIQVLGPQGGGVASSVKILNNYVSDADRIGIQVSHFYDLLISGNTVQWCGNNCIDFYGDINGQTNGDGNSFIISNNHCRGGLSGIFPETVSNGIVIGNRSDNMRESGIHVNRSWSQVANVLIADNILQNSQFGVLFTGDMSGVTLRGNYIYNANQAGVKLGQDGYRCSNVQVMDNTINTNTLNATPLVLFTGPQVAYCRVRGTITNNSDRGWDNVFYNLSANVGNVVSAANAS